MKTNYTELADTLLDLVGGEENIESLFHCATRLRFTIKDKKAVKEDEVKNTEGVMGLQWLGNQLQVIIGPEVGKVFDELSKTLGAKAHAEQIDENLDKGTGDKESAFTRFTKKISSCVLPLITGMIGCGLLKGVLSILVGFGLMDQAGSTYNVLYSIADSIFYFLPVLVGFTSAKAFGCNQIIGGIIGAALIHPSITPGSSLFGIQLAEINYASSLFPALAAVYVASLIEKGLKGKMAQAVENLVIPFLQVALVIPAAYLVIGPVMTMISNGLFAVINGICDKAPILGGIILGGFYQIAVVFGLHYALIPIFVADLMAHGYTTIGAPVSLGFFALAGMALGYGLVTKDEYKRSGALSAGVLSLLGLTEPALFTVAVPNPKHFISQAIGGAIGGLLFMVFHVTQYNIGASGLFGFAGFISPNGFDMNFTMCIIGSLIAFVIPLVISYLLEKRQSA
ncbi:MAG: PTS transporter subunit EIIC [Erysipelotrichaceae bacterium]|nr:PTS transporter subunit EIIC [Erysipelotrichaceae bacterium]MBR3264933.1 PTS transporter subunit EIIC [Erysipelotrichaceae bacterium]